MSTIGEQRDKDNVINSFIEQVDSESAKEALKIVDEVADLVCFHARVRKNAEEMLKPWRIDDA